MLFAAEGGAEHQELFHGEGGQGAGLVEGDPVRRQTPARPPAMRNHVVHVFPRLSDRGVGYNGSVGLLLAWMGWDGLNWIWIWIGWSSSVASTCLRPPSTTSRRSCTERCGRFTLNGWQRRSSHTPRWRVLCVPRASLGSRRSWDTRTCAAGHRLALCSRWATRDTGWPPVRVVCVCVCLRRGEGSRKSLLNSEEGCFPWVTLCGALSAVT